MLLVVAICLLILFVSFFIVKREKEYLLLCALAGSLIVYLVFILMYIAKKGGIGDTMSTILFLTDGFRSALQYIPMTLQGQGYGLAIGRYLFPLIFLLTALYYNSDSKLNKIRRYAWTAAILPVASLIFWWPGVFTALARTRFVQAAAVHFSRGWIVLYLLAGALLLILEPRNLRIRYIRRSAVLRCIMLLSVAALYALYCPQDPAQIYLFYKEDYMAYLGLWYLNPYLSPGIYVAVLVLNVASALLGAISMVGVARIEWSEDRDDLRLQRKYDTAGLSSSVFVHGIKNQLLANRVLCKRLNEQLNSPEPDLEQLRLCAGQLTENNEGLLSHLESLYQSFKEKSLTMRPCSLRQVVEEAVEAAWKKYPDAGIEQTVQDGLYVLADQNHLKAALVNLIVNAWEATLSAGRSDSVEITVYEKSRVNGVCIRDHGVGIGKYDLSRIFEPFYSSKNSKSNWGLGLYYVRNIVRKHMGQLKVESTYGSGTSFFILLPKLMPEKGEKRGEHA